MRGNIALLSLCGVACGGAPIPEPPPCAVEREQAVTYDSPRCISFVFDASNGGPLTCTPGGGRACAFVDEECATAPIRVTIGRPATISIGLHDGCYDGADVAIESVELTVADPAFSIAQPVPTSFLEDGVLLVEVAPTILGLIEARINVISDAINVRGGESSFRLIVDVTAP